MIATSNLCRLCKGTGDLRLENGRFKTCWRCDGSGRETPVQRIEGHAMSLQEREYYLSVPPPGGKMTPDDLRRARVRLGMTQAELALFLRLEPASGARTIRHYEAGQREISGPVSRAMELAVELIDLLALTASYR